ncbi:hypothetical protein HYT52_05340 [Candidatus Woesearchaeota archaeon]|nr:hypothetical protein [Candidatus Woesearchaeota archaeon]
MGLENVKQEILDQAQEKAEQLLEQAGKDAREIKSKASAEIAEYLEQAKLSYEKLVEAMEKKALAQARFDAQRLMMNAKKESVEEVLREVHKAIIHLNKTDKQKFLKQLLATAEEEVDVEKVFAAKEDMSLLSGVHSGVKVEAKDIYGGLIAQNKDGTISIDLSVDELLESAKNEMLVEISGVLFEK